MKNMMKNALEKVNTGIKTLIVRAQNSVANEKGVSTIEWVGLAAVIVALMFAVATAMNGQGSGLAGVIVSKISQMIQGIGN